MNVRGGAGDRATTNGHLSTRAMSGVSVVLSRL